MKKTVYLSYETIRNLRHELDEQDPLCRPVYLVWMAMTDWITAVKDCGEFLEILHKEVKAELTRENLEKHRHGYRGKYGVPGTAWKGETLADLEQLFDEYPDLRTLDEIFPVFNQAVKRKI